MTTPAIIHLQRELADLEDRLAAAKWRREPFGVVVASLTEQAEEARARLMRARQSRLRSRSG